ncbi:hypothetical protein AAFF_G00365630 [Aldrovandia affinis]|uniref:PiggyBac transposable element-derived protein domain-containing protein n=1 Tax=Aldrovandia affinis TaxID=143900 RepID=A0AAD7WMT0_9TELE|nr:hypothetical protein AAFF_G00365630 [Aldrovandia affinis]
MDQMVRNYTWKRQTWRWPMLLWHNLLDVATLNAYAFMVQHPNFMGSVKTRWLFIKMLVIGLVIPQMQGHMEGSSHLPKVITEAMGRCGVMKESHATTTQPQGQSSRAVSVCLPDHYYFIMSNREYSALEYLDHRMSGQNAYADVEEPEIEEVSEDEDDEEYDPEHDEETSDEEEEELDDDEELFISKDKKMSWSSIPYETHGKAQAENIIRMTPGPTRFAISRVQDIKSAFELFIPESIQKILIDMTNMEGRRVFKDNGR